MAPRDTTKPVTKAMSVTAKTTIGRSSPAKTKKTIIKTTEKKPLKMSNAATSKQNALPVPKVATPKSKEKKLDVPPKSVTKSAKKSWQRRPKAAHSGVPVPEKMKKLLERQYLDLDSSL